MKIKVNIPIKTAIILLAFFILNIPASTYGQKNNWVGSWSCAPYAAGENNTPPAPYLENNTLRQVVRVSIGGDTLRLKFSNKTCSTPVTMKGVSIAVSTGGSSIDESTITELKFNGNCSVTMNPYSSVASDPVKFALEPSARIAISIHYGQVASTADLTFHYGSRTDSYILFGNQMSSLDFSNSIKVERWYHINTIDVMASESAGCIGVLGNSITDGYGLHGGLKNKWTDFFSQKLLDDERTKNIGVLNLGIGATHVSGNGATAGINRFEDDLLAQSGIRWIIVFYGVNDIGAGKTASTIINAYETIIEGAHAKGVKVYGATITPFKGSNYFSEEHENTRNKVNKWIRKPGNFDAIIDFDKAIRDPKDTTKMAAEYSNDWLHPNAAGYEFLGNAVNIDF